MDGAMMRSAWARLQDFICKATDTQYPASRYSFNWDQDSGNASLKILGNTFRHTAVSEAAGKEGCAREAFSRGILTIILTEAKPHKGKESELRKLAAAYGNVNRLPSMEELYPGSAPSHSSPAFDQQHRTAAGPRFYNGPLPNIPSLSLPAPETAKERLQVFIADIFGESSPLFDQIDFVQARAGASPWSIILCNREYTSQSIYLDKEDGQEAAVRVALEKGALSVLLKEHDPQPQYHAAAVDLIAKFSSFAGLAPLPPPLAQQPGSRTPVPGQAGSATPLYGVAGGLAIANGASPYHHASHHQIASSMVAPMSPYHMPVVPVSPYYGGYASDAGFVSASGRQSPHREKRGRSSSRHRHSSRPHSKHRSASKRRGRSHSRHRRDSPPPSDASSMSSDASSRRSKRSKTRKSRSKRTSSRRQSRRRSSRRDHRSPSRQDTPAKENNLADSGAQMLPEPPMLESEAAPPSAPQVYIHSEFQEKPNGFDHTSSSALDINRELSYYLDYLLDSLDPREQETLVKEESPEMEFGSVHAVTSVCKPFTVAAGSDCRKIGGRQNAFLKRLDSSNREKIGLIQQACVLSATMQNVRSAIGAAQASNTSGDRDQEMVLLPKKWIEETMDILQSHR